MSRQTGIMSIVCVASIACAIGFSAEPPSDKIRQSNTIEIYAVPTKGGPPEIQVSDDGVNVFQAPRITIELTDAKRHVNMHVSETGPVEKSVAVNGATVYRLQKSKGIVVQLRMNQD